MLPRGKLAGNHSLNGFLLPRGQNWFQPSKVMLMPTAANLLWNQKMFVWQSKDWESVYFWRSVKVCVISWGADMGSCKCVMWETFLDCIRINTCACTIDESCDTCIKNTGGWVGLFSLSGMEEEGCLLSGQVDVCVLCHCLFINIAPTLKIHRPTRTHQNPCESIRTCTEKNPDSWCPTQLFVCTEKKWERYHCWRNMEGNNRLICGHSNPIGAKKRNILRATATLHKKSQTWRNTKLV